MKIKTVPATKLTSLLCTAVVGALLMLSDRASAVSIRDPHELGPVQFGSPSRYSDGSSYVTHLIGMALGSDERVTGQYFRSGNLMGHAMQPDHVNAWNAGGAGGRSVEVITAPVIGGVPGSGTGVPDGGITAMLLGTALGALGIARRYIRT
jgi:VPDSG-CTERM motif